MLELRELCATYGKRRVLHHITATFQRGTLSVIIGPNGSGKTTLLKTVAGILSPTDGDVLLDGESLLQTVPSARAKRIAYLAQGGAVPQMRVEELVLHGRFPHTRFPHVYSAEDRAIAAEAMRQMNMAEYASCALSTLSGGMRQKAYLALALAQQADCILLDEPTTYLDPAHRLQLMRLLQRLAREGHTVVAVLHDLPMSLEYADSLAVLEDGHLIAEGAPQELLASGSFERVFGVRVKRYTATDGTTYYSLREGEERI